MSAGKTLKTPVMEKRKLAAKETFSGRLDWKSKLYGMPATSTPKAQKPANDEANCFGFDDNTDEENCSALISPINWKSRSGSGLLNPTKSTTKTTRRQMEVSLKSAINVPPILTENNIQSQSEVGKNCEESGTGAENHHLETNKLHEKIRKVANKPKAVPKERKKPVKAKDTAVRGRVSKQKNNRLKQSSQLYDLGVCSSQELEADVTTNSFDDPQDEVVILKEIGGDTGFDALLHKYGKVDDDEDCELHVDASKIKRTYSSTRHKAEHEFVPVLPVSPKTKRRSLKKSKGSTAVASRRKRHPQGEDEDSETERWCALKNKEFEDVLHVPLVVTRQPSTTVRRSLRTQKKK